MAVSIGSNTSAGPVFGPDARHLGRRISNRDITERKAAERKIFEQNRKEYILTQSIQTIQTDIARDLHDTLGQNIAFLRMNLAHLSETRWSDRYRRKNPASQYDHRRQQVL